MSLFMFLYVVSNVPIAVLGGARHDIEGDTGDFTVGKLLFPGFYVGYYLHKILTYPVVRKERRPYE